jgi:hypothetical protein
MSLANDGPHSRTREHLVPGEYRVVEAVEALNPPRAKDNLRSLVEGISCNLRLSFP